jgi:hypothetical protein
MNYLDLLPNDITKIINRKLQDLHTIARTYSLTADVGPGAVGLMSICWAAGLGGTREGQQHAP